jgi:hypothetical protein
MLKRSNSSLRNWSDVSFTLNISYDAKVGTMLTSIHNRAAQGLDTGGMEQDYAIKID